MLVATAGHVDHGKTSLIRQLTGVDTDRLEEEKRRGLSINLGYAYRPVESGSPIGFIDVPGHHRFINTMIAGVSGIDLGMLVVAVDDGPMPQTREHLDVLHLLGVTDYLLILSKTDRVEAARVKTVQEEALALMAERGIGHVEVFPISNIDGSGIEDLSLYLEQLERSGATREVNGCFRLSIDRSFTIKGSGLVVTGTAAAGQVEVGEQLTLLPAGKMVRVRSLHVQDEPAAAARIGQRCALNLAGDVELNEIERGDWLTSLANARTTHRIDVSVQMAANLGFSIRHLSRLRMHIGARRIAAKIYLLQEGQNPRLSPGERGLAQLILDEPISCVIGERILLRDDSESHTLGGARVLDPFAPQSGKATPQRLHFLNAMSQPTPERALETLFTEGDDKTRVNADDFAESWNISHAELRSLYRNELAEIKDDRATWIVPEKTGARENQVRDTRRKLALSVNAVSDRRWQELAACYEQRGFDIPVNSQLAEVTGIEPRKLLSALGKATGERKLVQLTKDRYALCETMLALSELVLEMSAQQEPLTVVNFKARMGTGRKVAIEVLEYFDQIGFTRRVGDVRNVVNREVPKKLFG